MISSDTQFLKEVGIEPCDLDDSFPSSLSPPLPPEALFPKVREKDAHWLLELGVIWEQEPEPGFQPLKSLREYLTRYPNG